VAGAVLVEETVGIVTAKLLPDTAGAVAAKMAQAPSEVFGVLAKFRDEEVAAMRSLYPELLGPGRVDPALALRGANKGTWFGNILNERVRQRVQAAITEGTLTPQLRVNAPGPEGHRFLAAGYRHGLRPVPAQGGYLNTRRPTRGRRRPTGR
jgi:hypothetical protein